MNDTFLMLGIESSCDETAAALVKSDGTILASEIASQMEVHAAHGGVVPEIAARAHLDAIDSVIGGAMEKAGVTTVGGRSGLANKLGLGRKAVAVEDVVYDAVVVERSGDAW